MLSTETLVKKVHDVNIRASAYLLCKEQNIEQK